eukprot:1209344-Rhodomonas_salina.2
MQERAQLMPSTTVASPQKCTHVPWPLGTNTNTTIRGFIRRSANWSYCQNMYWVAYSAECGLRLFSHSCELRGQPMPVLTGIRCGVDCCIG